MNPLRGFSAAGLDLGMDKFKGRGLFFLTDESKVFSYRLKWVFRGWRMTRFAWEVLSDGLKSCTALRTSTHGDQPQGWR